MKSIAEIIGIAADHDWTGNSRGRGRIWTQCKNCFQYRDQIHTQYCHASQPDITPDLMLAWLHEHVRDDKWNTEGELFIIAHDTGCEVSWYCAAGADGVKAKTLHAALEAAVRVIHDAEEAGK